MLFADIDEIIDRTPEEKPIPDNEIRPYDGMTTLEQLDLYRNLHYCEGLANERGIIANAINDIIVQFNRQKAEIERLKKEIKKCEEHYKMACSERNEFLEQLESAKTESAEDFARRLKAFYTEDNRYNRPNAHTLIEKLFDNIDTVKKELVGEN